MKDGPLTADQLVECWCCDSYTERGSLCKDCEDAGCNRFGDECEVQR